MFFGFEDLCVRHVLISCDIASFLQVDIKVAHWDFFWDGLGRADNQEPPFLSALIKGPINGLEARADYTFAAWQWLKKKGRK